MEYEQIIFGNTIGAGNRQTVRPDAGYWFCITNIMSEHWIGSTPNGGPYIVVEIYDGSKLAYIAYEDRNAFLFNMLKVFLTHDVYMRILNTSGANNDIIVAGYKSTFESGDYVGKPFSSLYTIPAASGMSINPPSNNLHICTCFGSGAFVGATPNQCFNIKFGTVYGGATAYIHNANYNVRRRMGLMLPFKDYAPIGVYNPLPASSQDVFICGYRAI